MPVPGCHRSRSGAHRRQCLQLQLAVGGPRSQRPADDHRADDRGHVTHGHHHGTDGHHDTDGHGDTAPTSPGIPNCTNTDLSVRSAHTEGGDSHSGVVVVFTNGGTARCTLTGYPGADALDASGRVVARATRTLSGYEGGCGCSAPAVVRLAPGQSASALIEGDNGGGDECLRGHTLLVTPPNTTRAYHVPFVAYSCHLLVHPTVAGTTGKK